MSTLDIDSMTQNEKLIEIDNKRVRFFIDNLQNLVFT